MKYFFITIFVAVGIIYITKDGVYAARMYSESPETASSNREPFPVTVYLNPEGSSISAVSGDLSFPSELFDVKSIISENSIIPLWAEAPHIALEKRFDRKTHIVFEGAIPGGFSGVRGLYGDGVYAGIVFTVILAPKNSGVGDILLSSQEIHAYDAQGSLLTSPDHTTTMHVPALSSLAPHDKEEKKRVDAEDVSVIHGKDDLVSKDSSYIFVRSENPAQTIDHIEIVTTKEYNPDRVPDSSWKVVHNPYVLSHNDLSSYVHIKIVYTNNTYTYKTISPVENSHIFSYLSRILLYIIIAILLLYHYGKNFLHIHSKKSARHI